MVVVIVRHPLSNVFPILNDVPREIQPSSISNHSLRRKTLNASGYISYIIIMPVVGGSLLFIGTYHEIPDLNNSITLQIETISYL